MSVGYHAVLDTRERQVAAWLPAQLRKACNFTYSQERCTMISCSDNSLGGDWSMVTCCKPEVIDPERLGVDAGSRDGVLDTSAESLSKSAFS